MAGPLNGLRILEIAGIGPGPFAGMMLADMGAEVIRIDRLGGNPHGAFGHSTLFRSRRDLAVDLKHPAGIDVVLRLAETADAIFEGFRPGVAERLGIGPDILLARNPSIVYGRMTGWGQEGPLAGAAGHDINYIALSGALHPIGEAGRKPVVPLNLVGDFGGGGMLLAYGMVCALLDVQRGGPGQVVDAAMVDGASTLMQMFFSMQSQGAQDANRGSNLLDGGAPFYDTYETADGRWIALGSIEPQFYDLLRELLELDDALFDVQLDRDLWPAQKDALAEVVRSRSAAEWEELLLATDVCYAPVLTIEEAVEHPHNVARNVHIDVGGLMQPAPAPRFSVSKADPPRPAGAAGQDSREVLSDFGFAAQEIDRLIDAGTIGHAS